MTSTHVNHLIYHKDKKSKQLNVYVDYVHKREDKSWFVKSEI